MSSDDPSDSTAQAPLPPTDAHAENFARVREAHAREVAEDYVELIADLIEEEGEARAVSLAERFGVTAATVNSTIKRLERDGYVTSKPYRAIFLTEEGQQLAESCRERHRIVVRFLVAVGVSPATAEVDAEGIEHHVSEETLEVFRKVVSESE